MDYEKIGKFIAECRKRKGLTQKELAEVLNITDRAVSRWERGKGCPDVSLLEPLAKELKISVLELLWGEKIESDENRATVDILKNSKKKMAKWKILSFVFLNLLLFVLGAVFLFDFLVPSILKGNENVTISVEMGSEMEPTLKYGDQIYFEKKNINDIEVGDVILTKFKTYEFKGPSISFYGYPAVVEKEEKGEATEVYTYIRRVFQVLKNERGDTVLRTKADGSMMIDSQLVEEDNFVGKMKLRIPFVGNAYSYDFEQGGYVMSGLVIFFVGLGIIAITLLDVVFFKRHLDGRNN